MAAPRTDNFAHGVFLNQKKSKAGDSPDADLAQESELKAGAHDDPDKVVDSEALGLRHRRRFGYTAEGAEENDLNLSNEGRKPLAVKGHKRSYTGESRTTHFKQGVVHNKKPTTIVD